MQYGNTACYFSLMCSGLNKQILNAAQHWKPVSELQQQSLILSVHEVGKRPYAPSDYMNTISTTRLRQKIKHSLHSM